MADDLLAAQARIRRDAEVQGAALAELAAWVQSRSQGAGGDGGREGASAPLPPPRGSTAEPVPALPDVAAERAAGAAAYARGAYADAEAAFSRALDAARHVGGGGGGGGGGSSAGGGGGDHAARAGILSSRAQCHLAQRAYGEAIADASAALRADAGLVKAWQRRAAAAAAQGRPAAAARDLGVAVALLQARGGSGSNVTAREVADELRRCRAAAAEAARALAREAPASIAVAAAGEADGSADADFTLARGLLQAAAPSSDAAPIILDVRYDSVQEMPAPPMPAPVTEPPAQPPAATATAPPAAQLPPSREMAPVGLAPAHLRTAARTSAEFERVWRAVAAGGVGRPPPPAHRRGQAAFFLLYTMAGDGTPAGRAPLIALLDAAADDARATAAVLAARAWPTGLFRAGLDADTLVACVAELAAAVGATPASADVDGDGTGDSVARALAALPYYGAGAATPAPASAACARELGLRALLAMRALARAPHLAFTVHMLTPGDCALLRAAATTAAAAALRELPAQRAAALAAALAPSGSAGTDVHDSAGLTETGAAEWLATSIACALLGAERGGNSG